MSEVTNAHNGMAAVEAKDYKKGIELLTKAINGIRSPAWLLSRAQAYQMTNQLQAALDDADAAYNAASKRTQPKSKQQTIDAQYRRAVILLKMKRPADADACCVWSQQIISGKRFYRDADDVREHVAENGDYKATVKEAMDYATMPKGDALQNAGGSVEGRLWTRAYMTRNMALTQMEKLPEGDPGRKVTVERIPPEPKALGKGKAVAKPEKTSSPAPAPVPTPTASTSAAVKTEMPPPPVPVKPLRIDFFQTDKKVNINLFVKDTDKDLVEAQLASNIVTVSNLPPVPGASNPLYLKLDGAVKDQFSLSVTANKVEIALEKAAPGTKWNIWGEQHDTPPTPAEFIDITESPTSTPSVPVTSTTETAPAKHADPLAYPTSSKSGPKNWDNLDGTSDDKDEPDVNDFFKQIFKSGTPEQQRAMQKSFIESNGTALSTDWNDVGSRKVETHPPEGVEAKKW